MELVDNSVLQAVQEMNGEIRVWTKSVRNRMKNNLPGGTNTAKVKATTAVRNQVVDKVSFKFPKILVYREKGAYRGHGGKTGRGRWQRKDGSEATVNKKSLGKMNQGNAKARPWFNKELEKAYPELESIVARGYGRVTLRKLSGILIK